MREKIKLYCGRCHYATIYADEVKDIKQNSDYWFIEMKDGNFWEDADLLVFTKDENEKVGYFVEY